MKINSVKSFSCLKQSNPNFGAAFSTELTYKYKKLGYETLFKYGPESDEYKTYEATINELKKLCPDGTLSVNKDRDGYSLYLQSPYVKSSLVYSAPYKYQLFDIEGLRRTLLSLSGVNKGLYSGYDFKGTRDKAIEYIQQNVAPVIDRLF